MRRQIGVVGAIVLTLFCCGGWSETQGCASQPQPSHTGAQIAGVAIVAGVVVGTIVLVHHHRHTLKGCVYASPDKGLLLVNEGNKKTYQLDGVTSDVKAGDRFKLHGNRLKKHKGDDDQTFVVKDTKKDYGPCKATNTP